MPSLLARRDDAVLILVTFDRVVESLEKRLGVGRAGDDPRMESRLAALAMRLTEVKEEFDNGTKGVLAPHIDWCVDNANPVKI